MSCKIFTFPSFEREAKRLNKRYKSFKFDLKELMNELSSSLLFLIVQDEHLPFRKVACVKDPCQSPLNEVQLLQELDLLHRIML